MSKVATAEEAVRRIRDGDVVAVNSSSGLCCPDAVLAALGARFEAEGMPRDLTTIHPIAAGETCSAPGAWTISRGPECWPGSSAGRIPPVRQRPNRP